MSWLKKIDARDTLREAESVKDSGDIDGAIEILKQAYDKMQDEIEMGSMYGLGSWLILPEYLEDAGRFDEAWKEYNKLIIYGYPGQFDHKAMKLMDLSDTYSRMALSLMKQGKYIDAVPIRIFSIICDIKSRLEPIDGKVDKNIIKELTSDSYLTEQMGNITEDAEISDLTGVMVGFVKENLKNRSKLNLAELGVKIKSIIEHGP